MGERGVWVIKRRSVESPCQMICQLSFCFLWDCFLRPHSFLFCCVWPGVFPSCVKEGAETCSISCWGCYNMTYSQSTKAQWPAWGCFMDGAQGARLSEAHQGLLGAFLCQTLNSKTGTVQSHPGSWSSLYLMLKLRSYTSAAHIMKPD